MNNQQMLVNLGQFGTLEIGHKTMMGKASDIMTIGNQIRVEKGLNEITFDSIMRKQDFWEFVIELNLKKVSVESTDGRDFISDYSDLEVHKNSVGQIKYSQLMLKFPNLFRVQKRGNAQNIGTWMDLYLLLKLASYLSKALEVEIYDVFITKQLLIHREAGGEAFKKLNDAIDTLSDRTPELKPKGNKGCYINAAKIINKKINGGFKKGWNDEEKDSFAHSKREEYLNNLILLINMKYVDSWTQLKIAIEKL